MKDTKRALRRHHRQRMIARARLVRALRFSLPGFGIYLRTFDTEAHEWVCRNYDHLAACACWMCNRRRFWQGPPVQEIRENLRAMEEEDPMAFEP